MTGHHRKYDCDDNHPCPDNQCKAPLKVIALRQLAKNKYEYRELDGSGNNTTNEDFGVKDKPFVRVVPAAYNNGDGCSLNDLNGKRPNPRDTSNVLFDQPESAPDETCLSNMFWVWGQFIDHTITLTNGSDEPALISVTNPNDPLYPIIPFTRSAFVPSNPDCTTENPREQINFLSPFIDASNVYGDSSARNEYIRAFKDGKLKLTYGDMPPQNDLTMAEAGHGRGAHFVCGDIRANEQLGLTATHILFIREHNYWARLLKCTNSCLSDEELYQRAKIMVEAEMQAITYNEFIPKIIGNGALSQYNYDSSVNPQISNEFSVVAYRVGHSMVPSDILDGMKLRDAYFTSHFICNGKMSIGKILKQFTEGRAEKIDHKLIDDLRSFLFGRPGHGGMDLASLNIQRGRDHGIALINDILGVLHLAPIHTWSQLTNDPSLVAKLEILYEKPEDIDPWVYGLLEIPDVNSKSIVGSMMTEIIRDTFLRLRNGDRLWYENRLTKDQIELVNRTRLSDIIKRNTTISVDDDVFVVNKCVCGSGCYYHNQLNVLSQCEESGDNNCDCSKCESKCNDGHCHSMCPVPKSDKRRFCHSCRRRKKNSLHTPHKEHSLK
jgi:peroxidase